MSNQEILSQLPHRPPMLLVDEIVSCAENQIVCRKLIRADEFFLQGHYPGFPIVPGVILCEIAAQSCALLLSSRTGSRRGVPVLTRINDVRFKRMVRPGETVEITAKLDEELSGAFFLSATARVDQELAVRLTLACTIAEMK